MHSSLNYLSGDTEHWNKNWTEKPCCHSHKIYLALFMLFKNIVKWRKAFKSDSAYLFKKMCFLYWKIFNNKQQKMDLGEWGQTGNLSAELFPGVPELPMCESVWTKMVMAPIAARNCWECGCEMLVLTNLIYCALYSAVLKTPGIRLFCRCSVPSLVSSLDRADAQLRCLDGGGFSWVLCPFPLPRKVTEETTGIQRALWTRTAPAWQPPVAFTGSAAVNGCIWTILTPSFVLPALDQAVPIAGGCGF